MAAAICPAGCDVRGAGGFVIGPGAALPDGRGWVCVTDHPPVTQAAQLAWIESILRPPAAEAAHDEPARETSDRRGRAYAEQALHEIEIELAATREGASERAALQGGLPARHHGGARLARRSRDHERAAPRLRGEWIDQGRRRAGV